MISDWVDRAACATGHDPELWMPDGTAYLMAIHICRTECPVIKECLAHALETGEDVGIWGGTTPKERRSLGMRPSSASAQPLRFFRVRSGGRMLDPPQAS